MQLNELIEELTKIQETCKEENPHVFVVDLYMQVMRPLSLVKPISITRNVDHIEIYGM